MSIMQLINSIRMEITETYALVKSRHYSTALACIGQVRALLSRLEYKIKERIVKETSERSQANGKETRDNTTAETGEVEA